MSSTSRGVEEGRQPVEPTFPTVARSNRTTEVVLVPLIVLIVLATLIVPTWTSRHWVSVTTWRTPRHLHGHEKSAGITRRPSWRAATRTWRSGTPNVSERPSWEAV